MLINPFMSCSARLPVYVLIISAFFTERPGLVLFSIYSIGVFMAVIVALIFKKTLFKSKEIPFVMELPPYRVPTLRNTIKHMWAKGAQYLKKMGGIILIASIIVWALGYYPNNNELTSEIDKKITQVEKESLANKNELVKALEIEKNTMHQANSYIGRIGKFIEPVLKPLGFDWKMGVSIVTGVAAKEIVVSTMGVLYQVEEDNTNSLIDRLKNERDENGTQRFTPLVAFGFLVFILLYFPCLASVVAISKESGSWKWAIFTMFYTTFVAWLVSFIIYQVGSLII